MNVIDYFTEKHNEIRSDGTGGEMKSFKAHDNLWRKDKEIENMKKIFRNVQTADGKFVFRSFRETCSQELDKKGKLNIRKLNEFQFVIGNIHNKELAVKIMKKHLYNRADEKCFFQALDKHLFGSQKRFTGTDNKVKLILPACYFGHLYILEWLLSRWHDINSKNIDGETGLHLGNN